MRQNHEFTALNLWNSSKKNELEESRMSIFSPKDMFSYKVNLFELLLGSLFSKLTRFIMEYFYPKLLPDVTNLNQDTFTATQYHNWCHYPNLFHYAFFEQQQNAYFDILNSYYTIPQLTPHSTTASSKQPSHALSELCKHLDRDAILSSLTANTPLNEDLQKLLGRLLLLCSKDPTILAYVKKQHPQLLVHLIILNTELPESKKIEPKTIWKIFQENPKLAKLVYQKKAAAFRKTYREADPQFAFLRSTLEKLHHKSPTSLRKAKKALSPLEKCLIHSLNSHANPTTQDPHLLLAWIHHDKDAARAIVLSCFSQADNQSFLLGNAANPAGTSPTKQSVVKQILQHYQNDLFILLHHAALTDAHNNSEKKASIAAPFFKNFFANFAKQLGEPRCKDMNLTNLTFLLTGDEEKRRKCWSYCPKQYLPAIIEAIFNFIHNPTQLAPLTFDNFQVLTALFLSGQPVLMALREFLHQLAESVSENHSLSIGKTRLAHSLLIPISQLYPAPQNAQRAKVLLLKRLGFLQNQGLACLGLAYSLAEPTSSGTSEISSENFEESVDLSPTLPSCLFSDSLMMKLTHDFLYSKQYLDSLAEPDWQHNKDNAYTDKVLFNAMQIEYEDPSNIIKNNTGFVLALLKKAVALEKQNSNKNKKLVSSYWQIICKKNPAFLEDFFLLLINYYALNGFCEKNGIPNEIGSLLDTLIQNYLFIIEKVLTRKSVTKDMFEQLLKSLLIVLKPNDKLCPLFQLECFSNYRQNSPYRDTELPFHPLAYAALQGRALPQILLTSSSTHQMYKEVVNKFYEITTPQKWKELSKQEQNRYETAINNFFSAFTTSEMRQFIFRTSDSIEQKINVLLHSRYVIYFLTDYCTVIQNGQIKNDKTIFSPPGSTFISSIKQALDQIFLRTTEPVITASVFLNRLNQLLENHQALSDEELPNTESEGKNTDHVNEEVLSPKNVSHIFLTFLEKENPLHSYFINTLFPALFQEIFSDENPLRLFSMLYIKMNLQEQLLNALGEKMISLYLACDLAKEEKDEEDDDEDDEKENVRSNQQRFGGYLNILFKKSKQRSSDELKRAFLTELSSDLSLDKTITLLAELSKANLLSVFEANLSFFQNLNQAKIPLVMKGLAEKIAKLNAPEQKRSAEESIHLLLAKLQTRLGAQSATCLALQEHFGIKSLSLTLKESPLPHSSEEKSSKPLSPREQDKQELLKQSHKPRRRRSSPPSSSNVSHSAQKKAQGDSLLQNSHSLSSPSLDKKKTAELAKLATFLQQTLPASASKPLPPTKEETKESVSSKVASSLPSTEEATPVISTQPSNHTLPSVLPVSTQNTTEEGSIRQPEKTVTLEKNASSTPEKKEEYPSSSAAISSTSNTPTSPEIILASPITSSPFSLFQSPSPAKTPPSPSSPTQANTLSPLSQKEEEEEDLSQVLATPPSDPDIKVLHRDITSPVTPTKFFDSTQKTDSPTEPSVTAASTTGSPQNT